MKRNKKIRGFCKVILPFLFLFVTPALFAQLETYLPTDNPEVVSAFYTDTVSLLALLNSTRDGIFTSVSSIPVYANARLIGRIGSELGGNSYSCSIGSYIRLNEYLTIPLYAYIAGGGTKKYEEEEKDTEYYTYNGLFTGSGLICTFRGIGTIGAFGGYYTYWGDSALRQNQPENEALQHFRFGLIPVVNTDKIPLLKYVISYIQNYLAFDFNKDKLALSSYEIKAYYSPRILNTDSLVDIFNDFFSDSTRNFSIEAVYYGYGEKYLNPALKSQGHTVGINTRILNIFSLDYQMNVSKYQENISGWYRYYWNDYHNKPGPFNAYTWSHSVFFGLKIASFIVGMTFNQSYSQGYGDSSINIGFILSTPVSKSSFLSGYISMPTENTIDFAARFRQYHQSD